MSAQTGLASSLSTQHQFAAALDILTAVQAQRPDDLGIQAAIADAHIDLGDYETAFPAIDDLAAALPDNSATLSRQARVAALTGRNEDAVELAIESLNLAANVGFRRSDSASAWLQVAFFQYRAGMVDEAEQSLRSGLSIDEGHLGSRELLGKVLVAQGRLDEAASLCEDILVDTPAADLNGLLAEVYQALGRPEDADEQIQVGLELAQAQVGRFPSERRHLAGFFADQDPERFLDLMQEDIKTLGDIYGFDLLAWARHLNGDVAGAQAQVHKALRLGTEDAPMLFHAGMIELAAGDEDAGRDHLERSLELNPGSTWAMWPWLGPHSTSCSPHQSEERTPADDRGHPLPGRGGPRVDDRPAAVDVVGRCSTRNSGRRGPTGSRRPVGGAFQHPGRPPTAPPETGDPPSGGGVADGLDVVAVGVAHEGAVVVGVVLGPHPGLVEGLGAGGDRGGEERIHCGPVGGGEGDVGLTEPLAGRARAEPEVGEVGAEADDPAEVEHPLPAYGREHGVVERGT